jgi:hypothetical protein
MEAFESVAVVVSHWGQTAVAKFRLEGRGTPWLDDEAEVVHDRGCFGGRMFEDG